MFEAAYPFPLMARCCALLQFHNGMSMCSFIRMSACIERTLRFSDVSTIDMLFIALRSRKSKKRIVVPSSSSSPFEIIRKIIRYRCHHRPIKQCEAGFANGEELKSCGGFCNQRNLNIATVRCAAAFFPCELASTVG